MATLDCRRAGRWRYLSAKRFAYFSQRVFIWTIQDIYSNKQNGKECFCFMCLRKSFQMKRIVLLGKYLPMPAPKVSFGTINLSKIIQLKTKLYNQLLNRLLKNLLSWEWIFRYSKCSYGPDKLAPFRYRLEFSQNVKYISES